MISIGTLFLGLIVGFLSGCLALGVGIFFILVYNHLRNRNVDH